MFVLPASHVPLSQQPWEQLVGVQPHAPFTHCVPGGQLTHVPPAVPHAASLCPPTHVPFWQHPFGHVVALHGMGWQDPFWQLVPLGQL